MLFGRTASQELLELEMGAIPAHPRSLPEDSHSENLQDMREARGESELPPEEISAEATELAEHEGHLQPAHASTLAMQKLQGEIERLVTYRVLG